MQTKSTCAWTVGADAVVRRLATSLRVTEKTDNIDLSFSGWIVLWIPYPFKALPHEQGKKTRIWAQMSP